MNGFFAVIDDGVDTGRGLRDRLASGIGRRGRGPAPAAAPEKEHGVAAS